MKKIAFVLAVLLLAAPALAQVDVTVTAGTVVGSNDVPITYVVGTGKPRAFALNITVSDGNIANVTPSFVGEGPGYGIFPGTIDINDSTGVVDDDGVPVAEVADLPGDTLPGIGSDGVTIELASLYTGAAPPNDGTLCTIRIDKTASCNVLLALNVGRGGIVKEDKLPATYTLINGSMTLAPPTYTISGTISGSGQNSGVLMDLSTGTDVTSNGGTYAATVDPGWTGTITPTYVSSDYTPTSRNYSNVQANVAGENYTSALKTFTISGTVDANIDGSPLAGVQITGLPGAPVTGGGAYADNTVTYGWSGTAIPVKAGYAFNPTNRTYTNVTANSTQDYTAYLPLACWSWVSHCKGNATDATGGVGFVNLSDFIVWRDCFLNYPATTYKNHWNGGAGTYTPCADFDDSGRVNLADFILWRDNFMTFGAGCTPASWPPPLID